MGTASLKPAFEKSAVEDDFETLQIKKKNHLNQLDTIKLIIYFLVVFFFFRNYGYAILITYAILIIKPQS